MIGFEFIKERGALIGFNIDIKCPSCGEEFYVKRGDVHANYNNNGYYSTDMITCKCGFSSDFLAKYNSNFNKKLEFSKHCRKCENEWNFTIYDIEDDDDYTRCGNCGSRKIDLHIED